MEHDRQTVLREAWKRDFSNLIALLRRATASAASIMILSVEDAWVENDVVRLLRRELDGDFRIAEFGFERFEPSVRHYLQRHAPPDTDIVLARGLGRLPDTARYAAMQNLNRERDVLRQFGLSVVVFLHRDMVPEFARNAGDFWDCRSGLFEFAEPARGRLQAQALEQRKVYLRLLMQRLARLELRSIFPVAGSPRVDLEAVFVQPSVIVRRQAYEADAEMLLFRKLLESKQRAVILGVPGAGKSILLRYIAVVLAQGPAVAAQRLGVDPEVDWFPVLLPLSAYASALHMDPDLSLSNYLPRYFHSREMGDLEVLSRLVRQELEAGRCVVMLDGLDEIATVDQRREVVARIHDFVQYFPHNIYLVTNRIAGYERAEVGSPFGILEIAPLAVSQRRQLVRRWCRAMVDNPSEADHLSEELLDMVEREGHLTSLVASPLLLTILTHIYLRGLYLPQRRGELYRVATAALTETWGRDRSVSGRPVVTMLDDRPLDERRIVELLGPVAFWVHQEHPDSLVSRYELLQKLALYFNRYEGMSQDRAWRIAEEFVTLIQERSGILVEQQEGYFSFVHRTFEEYLAARYLATRRDINAQVLELLPDPVWEEVLVLVGDVLQGEYFDDYVRALLDASMPPEAVGQNMLLAGRCLNSAGRHLVDTTLGQDVLRGLADMIESPAVPFVRREGGAAVLGSLGDFRVQAMVEVPKGVFVIGVSEAELADYAEPGQARRLLERSAPARELCVPTFYIDRYPVTHAQYARFIDDGGYEREALWRESGWAWLSQEEQKRPAYWDDYRWNRPNYPVVGVSWYEADAYTRWAGKRLPTQAEWEKAARGTDARRWPWGNEWVQDAANVAAALGRITAVGVYPQNASPYGVLDMAGNVWEWTADWYAPYGDSEQKNMQLKVLRGGAWNTSRDHARCTSRVLNAPGARVGSVGFRCVRDTDD